MPCMKELKGLTSLRGIAALAVVMQHFSSTAQLHCAVTIPSLVPHGYVAVDFFFVLSGYIMCYTYLRSFQRDGWRAYKPFLEKRAIRLLPLNAFVTFVILGLGALSTAVLNENLFFHAISVPFDVVANLLMLQGLGVGTNLNGPSWSVSAEFLAYLVFPLLIFGVFSARRTVVLATALAALAALLCVALSNPRLGLGSEGALLGSTRCLSEFTLGMLAYRFGQSPKLAREQVAGGAMLVCVALLLLRVDLLVALTFPLIVAATARNEGRIDAFLSRPALLLLGNISYSLYLIHNLFRPAELALLRHFHPDKLEAPAALLFALVGSLSVIPFAWLTYRWVEHPSRDFLRRRFLKPAAA